MPNDDAKDPSGSAGAEDVHPGEWLAGALAKALPEDSPHATIARALRERGVQVPEGKEQEELSVESTLWCQSRFVCVTMHCGGSGWC